MADEFLKSLLQQLKEQQTKDVNEVARLKGLAQSLDAHTQERSNVIKVLEKTIELGITNILNR